MFMADIISHFWLRASTRVRRKMSSKDVSCVGTTMVSRRKKEKGKKIILRKYCWQEPASKCHRATASALLSSPVILQVTWTLCLDISVFAWCCHKPTYLAIVIFSPRGFPIQMFKYVQGQSIPDICHRHHRHVCVKKKLPGVNFYRFNAKNWHFRHYLISKHVNL